MRNKEEIEAALAEEMQYRDDPNHPMELHIYSHNQGWIEALEWVLGGETGTNEGKDNE